MTTHTTQTTDTSMMPESDYMSIAIQVLNYAPTNDCGWRGTLHRPSPWEMKNYTCITFRDGSHLFYIED